MHYYLIDERVSKLSRPANLDRIRSWIKTSRIAGQQLDLRSPQHILEEVKKIATQPSTSVIVIIGDDLSLDLAISALHNSKLSTILGFVPLVASSRSAELLNISDWRQATTALLKGKRKSFDLITIEDYATLTGSVLTPKATMPDPSLSVTLLLDQELTIQLPPSQLAITNTSHDHLMSEQNQPIAIEATPSRSKQERIQNKQPFIRLPSSLNKASQPTILRLKARTITIKTPTPLLLQNQIQLRSSIRVRKISTKQALIVNRKREAL
jgi:hypothetical protein